MWFLTKPEFSQGHTIGIPQVPPVALAWGSYGQGVGRPWEIYEVPFGSRLQFPGTLLRLVKPPGGGWIISEEAVGKCPLSIYQLIYLI